MSRIAVESDGPEPDIDAIKESYWDDYIEWCEENGVKPTMDGFELWYEETYF